MANEDVLQITIFTTFSYKIYDLNLCYLTDAKINKVPIFSILKKRINASHPALLSSRLAQTRESERARELVVRSPLSVDASRIRTTNT
jgi:hypothetical protein